MWRILLCLFGLSGQQDATFRANVDLIRVDVQVLDGVKIVGGLRREDFVVLDNGVPQPILQFGTEEQELDLLLVIDTSSSMQSMINAMKAQTREALTKLYFRDRVGIITFNDQAFLELEPTWDWAAVDKAIQRVFESRGGTELNKTMMLAARYLKKNSRPEARRGIIVLTDNRGAMDVSNAVLRDTLWESDVILSGVFFKPKQSGQSDYNANLLPFVTATGGESIKVENDSFDLGEILKRMRQRYGLLYRAPGGKPGSTRRIEIKMADPQRKHWKIRARTGYSVGIPNSEAREKLTLP